MISWHHRRCEKELRLRFVEREPLLVVETTVYITYDQVATVKRLFLLVVETIVYVICDQVATWRLRNASSSLVVETIVNLIKVRLTSVIGNSSCCDMSSKFEPPKFMDDASGYPEYKMLLLRWSRITKTPKEQQAEVVLYHLQGHPSGVQEKIDTALGPAVVNKDDGLAKLIGYLDTIYAEDPMSEAWSKYKRFTKLKRNPEQPVTEFIADFDKGHIQAKESGCEFSDIVLGFTLLEACELSETDEKFVLTAVDFATGKRDKNLLDQMKNSLRKFQSRDRLSSDNAGDRMKVKEEDALVASVKQALIADGWTPPSPGSEGRKKKKNPLDADGKRKVCFHCKSEYHLLDKCDKKEKRTEVTALSTVLRQAPGTDFHM